MTESCLAVKMNELAVDITTQTTLLVGKAACFRTVHVEQYQQYHGGQGHVHTHACTHTHVHVSTHIHPECNPKETQIERHFQNN